MRILSLGLAVGVLGCGAPSPEPADLVFLGGPVLTMAGAGDVAEVAEAVAVRGERIVAVGGRGEIERLIGAETRVVDLAGRALLPGFVDAHGHLTATASVVDLANLAPPPVGEVTDLASLRRTLVEYAERARLPEGAWLVGWGYDDSLLAERRHPTRSDLDDLFPDRPVALWHVSGHLMATSSRALEAMGIGADTPDPQGGVIRRRTGSREPDGVLEETALQPFFAAAPTPSLEQRLGQLERALALYARYGITTVQDGATDPPGLELLRAAAERGALSLDVIAYPRVQHAEALGLEQATFRVFEHRLELGGVKLVLDGSPQGKTAYLSEPYFEPPAGQPADYRGYPTLPQEEVDRLVADWLGRGVQILAHANGDAAADQLLDALAKAAESAELGDHRTVMIHAQTVRDDQLDRIAALGVIPSFFSAHTFYWGDWHRDSVLGPERAARISPTRSARARGIRFTVHNDAPIVPPDMMRLLWATTNRRTRSGQQLGPEEAIGPSEALRAMTIDAAYQSFLEGDRGSIEAGKLADLVVLSQSPLDVDPAALDEIEVVETFSHGRSVYRAEPAAESARPGAAEDSP